MSVWDDLKMNTMVFQNVIRSLTIVGIDIPKVLVRRNEYWRPSYEGGVKD